MKRFAHKSVMSSWRANSSGVWPGMLDGLPAEFNDASLEPAFSMDNVCFCIWRRYTDTAWSHGAIEFPNEDDADGSEFLLAILDAQPITYCQYAEDYFELSIPVDVVQKVYNHLPLTEELITSLNPKTNLAAIEDDLAQIGY